MKNELIKYTSQFPSLSVEEWKAIIENSRVREYVKGTILLKEGEKSSKCYLILKGCVRQYHIKEGQEKTTFFFTEEQASVSITSYKEQIHSNHYLACVEDSILITYDFNKKEKMNQKIPKFESIIRMMMEQDYYKIQEMFTSFISFSPEERYLNLLKTRPGLLQRVPQHQIASYLSMTPESLSRIRKRIFIKT